MRYLLFNVESQQSTTFTPSQILRIGNTIKVQDHNYVIESITIKPLNNWTIIHGKIISK